MQEKKGTKRVSDGDNLARDELQREEDVPLSPSSDWNFQPEPHAGPISVQAEVRRIENAMIDSVHTHSSAKGDAAKGRMKESFALMNRRSDMEVIRENLGCKVDVGEIYSPPRVLLNGRANGTPEGVQP